MTPRDWDGCEDDYYDPREGVGVILWAFVIALGLFVAGIAFKTFGS